MLPASQTCFPVSLASEDKAQRHPGVHRGPVSTARGESSDHPDLSPQQETSATRPGTPFLGKGSAWCCCWHVPPPHICPCILRVPWPTLEPQALQPGLQQWPPKTRKGTAASSLGQVGSTSTASPRDLSAPDPAHTDTGPSGSRVCAQRAAPARAPWTLTGTCPWTPALHQ